MTNATTAYDCAESGGDAGSVDGDDLLSPTLDVIPGAADCALVVVDADTGHVLALSDAAERLSGFTRSQAIGRPAWDTLVPQQNIGMLRAAAAACVSTDSPMNLIGPIRTAAGEVLQVEWFAAPLASPGAHAPQVLFYAETGRSPVGAARLFGHLMHTAARTAVLTTDLRGVVTFVSTGAAALFGLAPGELVGAPFPLDMLDDQEVAERAAAVHLEPGLPVLLADPTAFERRHEDADLGELDRRRRAVSDRPHVDSADWSVRRGDGRVVTVAVSTSQLRDHHGRVVGHISVGEDVTESRASQALLLSALRTERESVARLQELDRAKNEFVATVSHELRTPMTNIVGYVEHLRDGGAGPLSPAQTRALDAVHRNAERLSALADDLLVLLGLETSHPAPDLVPVDVRTLLSALREAVPSAVVGRDLDVEVHVPGQPLIVRGDQALLERAMRNLLTNAVKFTGDGGRITLTAHVDAEVVVLEVADSGIGMTPEDRRRVFGRFVRAPQAQEKAVPGAGLGLCIVDAVVREHGGQVLVESQPGVGSVFSILLPRVCSAPVEASA